MLRSVKMLVSVTLRIDKFRGVSSQAGFVFYTG